MENSSLHYLIYSKARFSNKDRPWLVFLAGYTGTYETWYNLIKILLNHEDCSILLIDNLGAGKSPQPEGEYNTQVMAQQVIELLNRLEINNICLFGHSMGGAIAQELAISNPEYIEHLFLISSFAQLDPVARLFLLGRYELLKSGADKQAMALATIPSIFGNSFLQSEENQKLAIQRMMNNPQTLTGMFGQLSACLNHDTTNRIQKIQCNTTVITGDKDILVNPEHSANLHANIQHSSFTEILDAGHMVQLEQPQQLANIIIKAVRIS